MRIYNKFTARQTYPAAGVGCSQLRLSLVGMAGIGPAGTVPAVGRGSPVALDIPGSSGKDQPDLRTVGTVAPAEAVPVGKLQDCRVAGCPVVPPPEVEGVALALERGSSDRASKTVDTAAAGAEAAAAAREAPVVGVGTVPWEACLMTEGWQPDSGRNEAGLVRMGHPGGTDRHPVQGEARNSKEADRRDSFEARVVPARWVDRRQGGSCLEGVRLGAAPRAGAVVGAAAGVVAVVEAAEEEPEEVVAAVVVAVEEWGVVPKIGFAGVAWLRGPRAVASMAAPEGRGRAVAAAMVGAAGLAIVKTVASGCAAGPGVGVARGAFAAAGAVEGSCPVFADLVDSSVEIS